jgi:insertion element IS1 protein InsB
VNHALLAILNPEQIEVEIGRADELEVHRGLSSELDERCRFVARKMNPRWLWHAIDPGMGKVWAYGFGRCKDAVFLQLKAWLELEPFGMTRYDPDGWGTSERHLEAERHRVGKDNTQKIASQYLHLRTRIKRWVRRTLCFCKTERMPDLVIGLFINRYELGRLL